MAAKRSAGRIVRGAATLAASYVLTFLLAADALPPVAEYLQLQKSPSPAFTRAFTNLLLADTFAVGALSYVA